VLVARLVEDGIEAGGFMGRQYCRGISRGWTCWRWGGVVARALASGMLRRLKRWCCFAFVGLVGRARPLPGALRDAGFFPVSNSR
jgi:hypothetical protein